MLDFYFVHTLNFKLLSYAKAVKFCIFFSSLLTWRDVQHLTVLTSKRNSLFDAKNRFHWTMNGVGLEFNHLFGFGVLDAGSIVTLAKQWRTVPARYHCEAGELSKTRYEFQILFLLYKRSRKKMKNSQIFPKCFCFIWTCLYCTNAAAMI